MLKVRCFALLLKMLFCFVLNANHATAASVKSSSVCQAYLLQYKDASSYNREAIAEVDFFKSKILPLLGPSLTRAIQIEGEYNRMSQTNDDNFIIGSVIKGKQEVLDYLDRTEQLVRDLDTAKKRSLGTFETDHIRAFVGSMASLAMISGVVVKAHLSQIPNFYMPTFVWGVAAASLIAAGYTGESVLKQVSLKNFQFQKNMNEIRKILTMTNPPTGKQSLVHDSNDSWVAKTISKELKLGNFQTKGDLFDGLARAEVMPSAGRFIQKRLGSSPPLDLLVETDRFFAIDPETNEPRMVVIIRGSREE